MDWKIYPNPVSDVLNIELANVFDKSYRIYIVNSLGQTVHSETVHSNKSQVHLSHLRNGWYGLILESEDFRITKSFLKI